MYYIYLYVYTWYCDTDKHNLHQYNRIANENNKNKSNERRRREKKEQNKYVVCYLCEFRKIEKQKSLLWLHFFFLHIRIVNKSVISICILEIGIWVEKEKFCLQKTMEIGMRK